jgi:hypothetical protein
LRPNLTIRCAAKIALVPAPAAGGKEGVGALQALAQRIADFLI